MSTSSSSSSSTSSSSSSLPQPAAAHASAPLPLPAETTLISIPDDYPESARSRLQAFAPRPSSLSPSALLSALVSTLDMREVERTGERWFFQVPLEPWMPVARHLVSVVQRFAAEHCPADESRCELVVRALQLLFLLSSRYHSEKANEALVPLLFEHLGVFTDLLDAENVHIVASSMELITDISTHLKKESKSLKEHEHFPRLQRKLEYLGGRLCVLTNEGVSLLDLCLERSRPEFHDIADELHFMFHPAETVSELEELAARPTPQLSRTKANRTKVRRRSVSRGERKAAKPKRRMSLPARPTKVRRMSTGGVTSGSSSSKAASLSVAVPPPVTPPAAGPKPSGKGPKVIHIKNFGSIKVSAGRLVKRLSREYVLPTRIYFALRYHIRFTRAIVDSDRRHQFVALHLLALQLITSVRPLRNELLLSILRVQPQLPSDLLDVLKAGSQVPMNLRALCTSLLSRLVQYLPEAAVRITELGITRDGFLPSLLHDTFARLRDEDPSAGASTVPPSAGRSLLAPPSSQVSTPPTGGPSSPAPAAVDASSSGACKTKDPRGLFVSHTRMGVSLLVLLERLSGYDPNGVFVSDLVEELLKAIRTGVFQRQVHLQVLRLLQALVADVKRFAPDQLQELGERFAKVKGNDTCLKEINIILQRKNPLLAIPVRWVYAHALDVTVPGHTNSPASSKQVQTVMERLLHLIRSGVRSRGNLQSRFVSISDGTFVTAIKHIWKSIFPPATDGSTTAAAAAAAASSSSPAPPDLDLGPAPMSLDEGASDAWPELKLDMRVFTPSVQLVCSLIDNHPKYLKLLHADGLTRAFLDTLDNLEQLNESALMTVPDLLRALSLNQDALVMVKEARALERIISIFKCPDEHMTTIVQSSSLLNYFGAALDEVFRHLQDLRDPGLRAIVDVLQSLATVEVARAAGLRYTGMVRSVSELVASLMDNFAKEFADVDGIEAVIALCQFRYSFECLEALWEAERGKSTTSEAFLERFFNAGEPPLFLTMLVVGNDVDLPVSVSHQLASCASAVAVRTPVSYFAALSEPSSVQQACTVAQLLWTTAVLATSVRSTPVVQLTAPVMRTFYDALRVRDCHALWSFAQLDLQKQGREARKQRKAQDDAEVPASTADAAAEARNNDTETVSLSSTCAYELMLAFCTTSRRMLRGLSRKTLRMNASVPTRHVLINALASHVAQLLNFRPDVISSWNALFMYTRAAVNIVDSVCLHDKHRAWNALVYEKCIATGVMDRLLELLEYSLRVCREGGRLASGEAEPKSDVLDVHPWVVDGQGSSGSTLDLSKVLVQSVSDDEQDVQLRTDSHAAYLSECMIEIGKLLSHTVAYNSKHSGSGGASHGEKLPYRVLHVFWSAKDALQYLPPGLTASVLQITSGFLKKQADKAEDVGELQAMGFPRSVARYALIKSGFNMRSAVEMLLSRGAVIESQMIEEMNRSARSALGGDSDCFAAHFGTDFVGDVVQPMVQYVVQQGVLLFDAKTVFKRGSVASSLNDIVVVTVDFFVKLCQGDSRTEEQTALAGFVASDLASRVGTDPVVLDFSLFALLYLVGVLLARLVPLRRLLLKQGLAPALKKVTSAAMASASLEHEVLLSVCFDIYALLLDGKDMSFEDGEMFMSAEQQDTAFELARRLVSTPGHSYSLRPALLVLSRMTQRSYERATSLFHSSIDALLQLRADRKQFVYCSELVRNILQYMLESPELLRLGMATDIHATLFNTNVPPPTEQPQGSPMKRKLSVGRVTEAFRFLLNRDPDAFFDALQMACEIEVGVKRDDSVELSLTERLEMRKMEAKPLEPGSVPAQVLQHVLRALGNAPRGEGEAADLQPLLSGQDILLLLDSVVHIVPGSINLLLEADMAPSGPTKTAAAAAAAAATSTSKKRKAAVLNGKQEADEDDDADGGEDMGSKQRGRTPGSVTAFLFDSLLKHAGAPDRRDFRSKSVRLLGVMCWRDDDGARAVFRAVLQAMRRILRTKPSPEDAKVPLQQLSVVLSVVRKALDVPDRRRALCRVLVKCDAIPQLMAMLDWAENTGAPTSEQYVAEVVAVISAVLHEDRRGALKDEQATVADAELSEFFDDVDWSQSLSLGPDDDGNMMYFGDGDEFDFGDGDMSDDLVDSESDDDDGDDHDGDSDMMPNDAEMAEMLEELEAEEQAHGDVVVVDEGDLVWDDADGDVDMEDMVGDSDDDEDFDEDGAGGFHVEIHDLDGMNVEFILMDEASSEDEDDADDDGEEDAGGDGAEDDEEDEAIREEEEAEMQAEAQAEDEETDDEDGEPPDVHPDGRFPFDFEEDDEADVEVGFRDEDVDDDDEVDMSSPLAASPRRGSRLPQHAATNYFIDMLARYMETLQLSRQTRHISRSARWARLAPVVFWYQRMDRTVDEWVRALYKAQVKAKPGARKKQVEGKGEEQEEDDEVTREEPQEPQAVPEEPQAVPEEAQADADEPQRAAPAVEVHVDEDGDEVLPDAGTASLTSSLGAMDSIDPAFLAALPADVAAEVLAVHMSLGNSGSGGSSSAAAAAAAATGAQGGDEEADDDDDGDDDGGDDDDGDAAPPGSHDPLADLPTYLREGIFMLQSTGGAGAGGGSSSEAAAAAATGASEEEAGAAEAESTEPEAASSSSSSAAGAGAGAGAGELDAADAAMIQWVMNEERLREATDEELMNMPSEMLARAARLRSGAGAGHRRRFNHILGHGHHSVFGMPLRHGRRRAREEERDDGDRDGDADDDGDNGNGSRAVEAGSASADEEGDDFERFNARLERQRKKLGLGRFPYDQDRAGQSLVSVAHLPGLLRPLYLDSYSRRSNKALHRAIDHLCTYEESRLALFRTIMLVITPVQMAGSGAPNTGSRSVPNSASRSAKKQRVALPSALEGEVSTLRSMLPERVLKSRRDDHLPVAGAAASAGPTPPRVVARMLHVLKYLMSQRPFQVTKFLFESASGIPIMTVAAATLGGMTPPAAPVRTKSTRKRRSQDPWIVHLFALFSNEQFVRHTSHVQLLLDLLARVLVVQRRWNKERSVSYMVNSPMNGLHGFMSFLAHGMQDEVVVGVGGDGSGGAGASGASSGGSGGGGGGGGDDGGGSSSSAAAAASSSPAPQKKRRKNNSKAVCEFVMPAIPVPYLRAFVSVLEGGSCPNHVFVLAMDVVRRVALVEANRKALVAGIVHAAGSLAQRIGHDIDQAMTHRALEGPDSRIDLKAVSPALTPMLSASAQSLLQSQPAEKTKGGESDSDAWLKTSRQTRLLRYLKFLSSLHALSPAAASEAVAAGSSSAVAAGSSSAAAAAAAASSSSSSSSAAASSLSHPRSTKRKSPDASSSTSAAPANNTNSVGTMNSALRSLWVSLDRYLATLSPPPDSSSSHSRDAGKSDKKVKPARAGDAGKDDDDDNDTREALRLLPLVHCFFLVNQPDLQRLRHDFRAMHAHSAVHSSAGVPSAQVAAPEDETETSPSDTAAKVSKQEFLQFAERHRRILNVLCHKHPQLLHGRRSRGALDEEDEFDDEMLDELGRRNEDPALEAAAGDGDGDGAGAGDGAAAVGNDVAAGNAEPAADADGDKEEDEYGALYSLYYHPKKVLDFDNKLRRFRWQTELLRYKVDRDRDRAGRSPLAPIQLLVRRDQLFSDSYHQLKDLSGEDLAAPLQVRFLGEPGVDAGGLTREWYLLLSRQIFDAQYALFTSAADNNNVFQPNRLSFVNPEHLEFFEYVGKFVAKAIYDGQLLDAYFTRSFYKHLLGLRPTYHDIESVDPTYYKGLCWMLENPVDGVLDNTFTLTHNDFGQEVEVELKPGGRDITVTDENKREFVELVTHQMMTRDIRSQINAFVRGFRAVIPQQVVSVFDEHELELLICGLPDIDMADLRANTEYNGYKESDTVIQWFWQIVEDFDQEERALLLQFVTGTSKVPIDGFKSLQGSSGTQRFQIHRAAGKDRLPTAHTCFNQLDLGQYSSYNAMSEKLLLALHAGSKGGFGFR